LSPDFRETVGHACTGPLKTGTLFGLAGETGEQELQRRIQSDARFSYSGSITTQAGASLAADTPTRTNALTL